MKTIPVIGALDDAGEAREYPAVKVIGGIGDFLECPACGALLDKRDLGKLLAHEEACPASS